MRYLLQESTTPNYYVCTDTLNNYVCKFEHHNYNDNQKVSFLDDNDLTVSDLARLAREMGDWLRENHPDKIFKLD